MKETVLDSSLFWATDPISNSHQQESGVQTGLSPSKTGRSKINSAFSTNRDGNFSIGAVPVIFSQVK